MCGKSEEGGSDNRASATGLTGFAGNSRGNSSAEVFRPTGRPDKGARDEIDRLIRFLVMLTTLAYFAAGADRNTILPALLALETERAN